VGSRSPWRLPPLALVLLLAAACRTGAHRQIARPALPPALSSGTAASAMGGAADASAITTPIASAAPAPGPAPAGPATLAVEQSQAVQTALEALVPRLEAERQRRGVPGVSVGVVYDQTLIWSRGFGTANVQTGAPATTETLYRVGSITKLFTDTMLLQLRDAGKLDLDDPIEHDLPELNLAAPYASGGPTFRQLASHTSGLPREAPLNYWRTRAFPTEAELLESLRSARPIAAPGTVYQYSNLGVALEGMGLERVAGEPYRQYVIAHILDPLGMSASGFDLSNAVRTQLAVGSSAATTPEGVDRLPDFGALTPAAGLYTSVDDIAKFIALQFRDGNADTGTVLGGRSLQEMHNAASRGSGPGDFAIGWEVGSLGDHTTIGHPGVVYGFTTQLSLVPESKLGVAVFTNGRTDPAALADEILSALLGPVAEAAGS
jgi:CubicO group peptidase (beta-lactamase class C family)